jgi:hypothetical protein
VDQEESKECIKVYKCVNPKCSSNHEYRPANTLGCIGPKPVSYFDDG